MSFVTVLGTGILGAYLALPVGHLLLICRASANPELGLVVLLK